MNRLVVDEGKCTGCGKCEERCGFKRVVRVNETGKASFKKDRSECIECFHCLMICPKGAIGTGGDGSLKVREIDGTVSPVMTRRSCRIFETRTIDDADLDSLIQDAGTAPRAYIKYAERKFIVVQGEKLRELRSFLLEKIGVHAAIFRTLMKIPFLPAGTRANLRNLAWCFTRTTEANREREQLFQGAPAVVMVTGPLGCSLSPVNSDYALMQLLVLAEERGLGTCISGYLQGYGKAIGSFLRLPEKDRIFCGAMIGYPAAKFARYAVRTDTPIGRYR